MSKELKLYEFFYKYAGAEGRKFVVTQKWCKDPERTKEYKTLTDNFQNCFISSYGYEQVEN
jgi:hypothetical protein|tara:strand:- start:491 stop:673 length:183 start_codon:yes stop_codon:yes gene_type:complete